MAVALTKFRSWGVRPEGPQPARGLQYIQINFTAATSDVDLDFGDFDGTFWAAADDTAIGALALEKITLIEAQIVNAVNIQSEQLLDRVPVGTLTAAGQFKIDFADSDVPNLTVNTADGETAWVILIAAQLADGIEPINVSLG